MSGVTEQQAKDRLQQIFRDEFDQSDLVLRDDMTSADIRGWDSHKQIELILACEDAFGIRLKPREINSLKSVGEMARHLAEVANRS